MKSNRVYFLNNKEEFAEKLLERLEDKYDVDVFYTCHALKDMFNKMHPIAIISTLDSEENFEMMKSCRGVPFKSQYLAEYTREKAFKYGKHCSNVASHEWMDEILNACFMLIDSKIVNQNMEKVRQADIKNKTIPENGYSSCDVRMKTKESARLPVCPVNIDDIIHEKS